MKNLALAAALLASLSTPALAINQDLGPLVMLNAAAAGTTFSGDQINQSTHAVKCVVNITSIAAGSLTVTIYGKDGASGTYYSMLASTAIGSAGQTVLTVGPGVTVSSNVAVSDFLPPIWRVGAVVATGPVSATVGCSIIE